MLDKLANITTARRIVVKIGSALLVGGGQANEEWLMRMAGDLAALRRHGAQVIVVSSGAIALGAARLDLPKGGRGSLADAQAAAAVGQIGLADLWSRALGAQGITAAQVLLTLGDLEERRRYLNVSATLDRLLEAGAIPVINENDTVATAVIRFGDNDRLAARVAQAANADLVLLLSDIDGLYDRHPREPGAKLVPVVKAVTPKIRAMASGESSSGLGSGGMTSKLQAAQIATRAGIALAILNGTHDAPIAHALAAGTGTLFLPVRSDSARKAWLGGRLAPAGELRVDQGCAQALRSGASLLAAGIVEVSGNFRRGDLVSVLSMKGERLAQGLTEYNAADAQLIAGKRGDDQAELLGYAPRSCVIHRDHMVLL
ncbi:glutamate 5-kinase [Porphyrobacter sp. AAP60]|uniref:glutamate 5-kinase n=1 Tax=Porphyrobacter sp. AAP60 TaxID=1523423 RepID=UPI0006B92279|nr:glutamate 5-kinase [Porphyrobacter sp. AAP60]KPF61914.1 glutamate 5-kinase [Porphyrobacter sp. AAP60]